MRIAVTPLPTGDVVLSMGEDGCEGLWSVTRAQARAAADRLAEAACMGLPSATVMLWRCGADPVWFEGASEALQRLCDALRMGADLAERRGAPIQ